MGKLEKQKSPVLFLFFGERIVHILFECHAVSDVRFDPLREMHPHIGDCHALVVGRSRGRAHARQAVSLSVERRKTAANLPGHRFVCLSRETYVGDMSNTPHAHSIFPVVRIELVTRADSVLWTEYSYLGCWTNIL